ncbi:Asp23/Gls24 family envelope stress response protein [Gordonia sp. L191]|uniref:Asp23/Gls24 family envelope stress response protein n=1 Tax=Gordonia sp. L191 TaxID=2982699 RepID=UPI0024BF1E79|nr:Asp23/Gls24 family envelope stress response protein [Gordonia sp. L191]WHU48711.1 Asp23/Gls24 family envelope stress response protein [Gordonia sp. L191]
MTDSTVTEKTKTTAAAATDTSEPTGKGLALARESGAPGDRGRTVIADAVVAKIAGIATREIDGVHDVGGAAERVVGKVREVLPGTSVSTTQGINVEVGEKQAAVDVSIVADFGVAIHQLAAAIRRNVINAIESMTGLEVTEVNVTVHDINFGDDDDDQTDTPPRVQ